jgi:hypothetical protein
MDLKVMVRAGHIPVDSMVSKINGTKQYLISSSIRFFCDKKTKESYPNMTAGQDVVFLINGSQVNIVSSETELVWHTTTDELFEYCQHGGLD